MFQLEGRQVLDELRRWLQQWIRMHFSSWMEGGRISSIVLQNTDMLRVLVEKNV